jgi:SulP family sulfate permease
MEELHGAEARLPLLYWLRTYKPEIFVADLLGAAIVSFLFIPQSLGYALQAGLPPMAGIYASILPLLGYVLFGTSRTLAIGPFAITSLLTGAALSRFAEPGTAHYGALALILTAETGLILLMMGLFKLGYLSNFISYPVSSGYITGSAILIAASQLKSVLGVTAKGNALPDILRELYFARTGASLPSLAIGVASLVALVVVRQYLQPALMALGLSEKPAKMLGRTGPLIVAGLAGLLVYVMALGPESVKTVGALTGGMPLLTIPEWDISAWRALLPSAALISLIGFVGSVSAAQSMAAKSREMIFPDKELLGQGVANLLSSLSGGFPVTGGLSRTAVNSDAGVRTPLASIFTAFGIMTVSTVFSGAIAYVPLATLAATIIVAAISLVDFHILTVTWRYSKADFTGAAITIAVTLLEGVEIGVLSGVLISILTYLRKTSQPHMAVVGLMPDSEHFRNVLRHKVLTDPSLVTLRVDESLYFANAKFLESKVMALVHEYPQMKNLVLLCSAVNQIDSSALESLRAINDRLRNLGITFHLSEVKGPVTDRLQRSDFLQQLSGRMFLSQFQAISELAPQILARRRKSLPGARG